MDNTVYFAAIDASTTTTAISILSMIDDNKFMLHDKTSLIAPRLRKKDDSKFLNKKNMYDMFKFYFDSLNIRISFAVFENYSYGSPGHLADLGELTGLFKFYLNSASIPFDTIPPTSVKMIVGKHGHASKPALAEAIIPYVVNIKDFVFNNYDETDSVAVGIAYAIKMMGHIDEPTENIKPPKKVRRRKQP